MQSSRKFSLGSYKNGIETTLGLLDETLIEFEALAHGRENTSLLYRERNTLSGIPPLWVFRVVHSPVGTFSPGGGDKKFVFGRIDCEREL